MSRDKGKLTKKRIRKMIRWIDRQPWCMSGFFQRNRKALVELLELKIWGKQIMKEFDKQMSQEKTPE